MLSSVRVESTGIAAFELSAPWGLKLQESAAAVLFAPVEGRCLMLPERGEAVEIEAGDVLLIQPRSSGSMVSAHGAPTVSLDELWAHASLPAWSPGKTVDRALRLSYGGGGAVCRALSLVFGFREELHASLASAMPATIVLRKHECSMFPWMEFALQFLVSENDGPSEGYSAVATRLSELLFVHILRAHLSLRPQEASGWLRGVTDKRVARALSAMHATPGEPWTVHGLATTAGMSRSAFAARFSELVGKPPLDYLYQHRMDLAVQRLEAGEKSIDKLARDLGYSSQHAFAFAFRRTMGVPPGEYRRQSMIAKPDASATADNSSNAE